MLLIEFGSKASSAINAAKKAYIDIVTAHRRRPSLEELEAAVQAAVGSWNPVQKGKTILTDAARKKLAAALAHLAFNLAAAEGDSSHPVI